MLQPVTPTVPPCSELIQLDLMQTSTVAAVEHACASCHLWHEDGACQGAPMPMEMVTR